MTHTISLLFLCLSIATLTQAQSSDYQLFRKAVSQLYEEVQLTKKADYDKYEASQRELKTNNKQRVNATVLGAPNENKDEIEQILEETITEALELQSSGDDPEEIVIEPPPPPPLAESDDKTASTSPANSRPKAIELEVEPMFPDQPSAKSLKPSPRTNEPIQWQSTEVVTFTEEISLDDIKDPNDRAHLERLARHQENVSKVNRNNLVELLHRDSATEAGFQTILSELEKGGYSLAEGFKRLRVLDPDEQLPYLKNYLSNKINEIVYPQ